MKVIEKYREIPVRGRVAINSVLLLVTSGTIFYHYFEGWSWIQSLYFTVITLTTVGYGDFHPTNDFTRLFTVFFVISGISTLAAFLSLLGERKIEKREKRVEARE